MPIKEESLNGETVVSKIVLHEGKWSRKATPRSHRKVHQLCPFVNVGRAALIFPRRVARYAARALNQVDRDAWPTVGHTSNANEV